MMKASRLAVSTGSTGFSRCAKSQPRSAMMFWRRCARFALHDRAGNMLCTSHHHPQISSRWWADLMSRLMTAFGSFDSSGRHIHNSSWQEPNYLKDAKRYRL